MIRVSSETGFKEADKIIHEYLAYLEQELVINNTLLMVNLKD